MDWQAQSRPSKLGDAAAIVIALAIAGAVMLAVTRAFVAINAALGIGVAP